MPPVIPSPSHCFFFFFCSFPVYEFVFYYIFQSSTPRKATSFSSVSVCACLSLAIHRDNPLPSSSSSMVTCFPKNLPCGWDSIILQVCSKEPPPSRFRSLFSRSIHSLTRRVSRSFQLWFGLIPVRSLKFGWNRSSLTASTNDSRR